MSAINERLLELETENGQLKAQLTQKDKDMESLQLDFTAKLAAAQVDFDTKELTLKRQINDLTRALEQRKNVEHEIHNTRKRKSIAEIYDEITK